MAAGQRGGNTVPLRVGLHLLHTRWGDNVEGHDLVRVVIVAVVVIGQIPQLDPGAWLVLTEIDQHLVALGHGVPPVLHGLGPRHQTAVGGDHVHRVPGAECEPVGARDGRVQDPETVYPRLDLHHRPRPAVDEDHIPPQSGMAPVVIGQGTIFGEHCVADNQRNVEGALRQQPALNRVMHDVDAGKARINILRGVMHPMVVIPERPGRLGIRVEVFLAEPRRGHIVGVPVILRQRRRTMQVG